MRLSGKNRSSTNAIDERAIEFVVRLDKEDPGPELRAQLDDWLAADPRHLGAYVRAQAVWRNFDRLGILTSEEFREAPQSWFTRRNVLATGGGAVGLAAAVAVGAFVWTGYNRVLTPLGKIIRVPLNDGSVATVNTNSALNIALKPNVREIVIDKGEAWFNVVRDNSRPFIVAAGEVRVRAVGTAFAVRRRDDGANVLVTEGIVDTWTVNDENRVRRVTAGSKIFVSDIAGPSNAVVASTEIDRTLAWRDGEIALDGETLDDAVAEFNRYNERKLTVDPALGGKRLVGWFHTDEPEAFARAVATKWGADIGERDEEIHLAPKS
jgi:transmembrane sensor